MSVLLGVFSSDQEMYPYTNPNPQHWYPYPNGPPPQYPPVNYTVVPSQQQPPPPPQYPYQQPQYFPPQQPFAPPPQYTPQVQPYPAQSVHYAAHPPPWHPPQWYPPQWYHPQPQTFAPPQQYYEPQRTCFPSQQQYGPLPQPAHPPQPQTHHFPSQSAPGYVPSQPLPQYDATTVAPAQCAPVSPQRQMTRSPSEASTRGSSRHYCFDEDYQSSSDLSRSSSPERGFDHYLPTETDIVSPTDIASPDLSTVSFGSLLDTEGTSLAVLHWESWMAALTRAKKVADKIIVPEGEIATIPPPCDKFFDPMPWKTCHRKLRRHHIYPNNEDGSRNYGMLWAELYLCRKSNQFGLCWYTFGTPDRCPLGAACRWEHYLPWRKLRFLITSGRVSVELARQMMANLKSDQDPDQHPKAIDNMEAIIIGLGERLQPKVLLSRRGPNAWSWEDIYSAPAVVG